MKSFEDYWHNLGVEAWAYADTAEEALAAYLELVPVVERSFIRKLFSQKVPSNIASQAQTSGIARLHRRYDSFPRRSLLWSRQYVFRTKGQLVKLEQRHGIYHRTGWNPVIAPLALHGLRLTLPRPSVMLLGDDLVRWAKTFATPDTKFPAEWSAGEMGAGSGMLFVPSDNQEVPEEWIFYLEPGCYITRNLKDLIQEVAPILSSRMHLGQRVIFSLLIGFGGDLTSGNGGAKIRYKEGWAAAAKFLMEKVHMADIVGIGLYLYTVMSLRDKPRNWKYYECTSVSNETWGPPTFPFR